MRERTPSADDTPKRAPPAPSREAVVAGSETSSDDTIEAYHTAKLHGISSVSGATSSADRMVASMQSLEDLAVNHPANATGSNGDRQQQQQERYGHAYRSSAQTAQDKRSRLSNVINNLRKKVPDGTAKGNAESPRKEEDDRNSVERNLETLEKYVMTVLNGVIKDDEEEDKGKSAEKMKETERRRKDSEEEENPTGTTVKPEPSNESDIEAAMVPCLEDSSMVENAESSKIINCVTKGVIEESVEVSEIKISQDSKELSTRTEEEHVDVEKEKSSESDRDISREKKENQTLGTIIMDRLSEHQVEERANVDDGRGRDRRDECVVSENVEVQAICIELLDKVLNDVYVTIDNQKNQREECEKMKEFIDTTESKVEEIKDSNVNSAQELKSLHCSLPLDKIAFVLQNCQTSESATSVTSRLSSGSSSNSSSAQKSKSSSCTTPPVRLLCLYCDRKFLSISLRQRHTERVHQFGGRRSERNFRKSSQNCQYCSEKCADTLETLFQHMISNHGDKYHACVQCLTRYPTREVLMGHMNEMHGGNAERTTGQTQSEKIKEGSSCKEFCNRDMIKVSSVKERRSEGKELETSQGDSRQSDSTRSKLIVTRDSIDNPVSPEFDSSFYSNVSCNIRENLLHHLDGKLQTIGGGSPSCAPSITVSGTMTTSTESKSQQQQQSPQQSYYEHSVNQIQFPIDISLTAATPVYSKDYSAGEEYENSSEYARKAGKTSSSSRPRRVSFEKYNFPRKYDGKEQWTCSIEDLSKFDISTQLSLQKKQQLIKERLTINRLHQTLLSCETTEVSLRDQEQVESIVETTASSQNNVDESYNVDAASAALDVVRCNPGEPPPSEKETTTEESSSTSSPCLTKSFSTTEFTIEFIDFMRLKRREPSSNETANVEKISYAELSGEWSRTRIYICGACGSKHMTLKEMEDHKASTHPRVLCSHFELTGDQREHYKHLYLPGRSVPTDEARDAMLAETVCTKCTKTCLNVAELHRHMLECGGDHAWLLGLTGSGKRKCKWRPFGSRSRRRRQRGMKRNIQNSQTQPRIVNTERPKEKQAPTGPRVRPSDRESIQKMLANLPAKRATRKVLQDNVMRSQSKLRNVQTRTRPRIIGDNSSVSRISRNKAALRNKLLKNAKSIQRKRCRSDNITAVIESVVKNYHETEKKLNDDDSKNAGAENENKKDAKEINEVFLASKVSDSEDKPVRSKVIGRPKIFGRKGNVKTKTGNNSQFQCKAGDKLVNLKARGKSVKFKSNAISKSDAKGEETSSPKNIPKNSKMMPRTVDKNNTSPDNKRISTAPGIRGKSKLTQSTLKRKRPVDPVASLNASLKAKLQLRTQDGKFARNPNKNSSTKSEMKMSDGKHKAANSIEIKLLKSKTIQKLKKDEVQLPRRTTRLSSDSDKMPTLEPVMQIVSSNEEYTDKSTNDLPILSPVTSSGSLQDQKTPRTFAKYVLKEKESNTEINTDCEVIPEKSTKEQKPTRGRKPKQESKDTVKRKEIVEEDEISKNNTMMLKGRKIKNKKNLYNKNTNNGENNKEGTSKGEIIAKKDLKPRKEETTRKTRTNWKRFRRSFSEKDSMKLATFPFEVQKLLNSVSSFSGILDTLELGSNDTDSKRNLRQWLGRTPRSKVDLRDHMNDSWKKWKRQCKRLGIETIRKSSRKNVGKKTGKMMKTINLEKDSINNTITKDTTNNVEKSQPSKKDNHANTKIKEINNPDIEDKIDSRQTRRSLIDTKSEPPEIAGGSSQKGSGLFGKRRSRNKSIDDPEEINARAMQKQNNDENVMLKEVQKEEELEEAIDKNEIEGDDNSNSDRDSAMVNLSLNHLQSETSNLSIDSGKENSLETSVNIHNKLKVTRPKKTWGARRERSSRKRSLNNVIGILTEGINIPVEQSVQVLTVQTSLDNPDRVARNGSTQQSVDSENNMIAVDSAFSELSVLPRNEQESAENKVISTNANDNQHADNEKNAHPCIDKAQDENNFTDQIDISSKVSTAKMHSPTNDIILDLSRRKPKGKGSFLEKIVSKIAKQKDALLEGEVGSLLDNAADELTSILNEVGPALVDNAESANFGEVSYTTKNENESITSTSTDKKLPVIVTSEIQSLQDDITNIKSATSNHSTDLLVIQDNLEGNLTTKIEMQAQSKNQTKINDVSDVEIKDNYIIDKQASDMRSVEELQVEFCENKSATNEEAIIPMEIPDETPSSLTDTLTEISISSITTQKLSVEKLEKKTSGIKSRRKSSKRSLEDASWPKKSKRKSLEIDQELAEKNIQKDWFDDVIVTNSKQKEMFNVGHELAEKVDEPIKISKIDVEVEKLQCSESKIIKDLELSSSLEKILAEDEESNLEKLANLPEAAYEETNELTTSFKEAVDKIISDGESNVRSIELIEEGIESTLSLKKTVKSGKFTDRTQKKNQKIDDASKFSHRRTSKRKTQLLSDVLQPSMKPVNEEKKLLPSSPKGDSLEFTDEKLMKVGTTNENSDVSLEETVYSVQITSEKNEEIQNADGSSLVNSTSSETTKKHGTKKKSLADEHLDLPKEPGKVTSKFNKEINVPDSNEQLSVNLDHFKVPEVKDLLQSGKKRGPKKKLPPEDNRYNGESVSEESRINEELAEVSEMSNLIEKVEEQVECKKHIVREQSSRKKLERSSSSSSIGFIPSLVKTRSMFKKKTQLSSEDLAVSNTRNQDAESTDDLSESSCVSESSYFRKKRFAKRKRKEENLVGDNDEQADSMIVKSNKGNSKKPQNAKSLLDEHLDLSDVDDIEIPMDIQASLENTKALENIEREFELAEKSLALQNEDADDKPMADESANKDITTEQSVSNNYDSPDDPVTPKKRAAGNFVVVHTKTGEILIVEKRKKLTKEAARFFCDVCATSFTRKSSLKKHTLSQSHLSQMAKSTKDKLELVNNGTSENNKEIDEEKSNQVSERDTKNVLDDAQSHEVTQKSLESDENYVSYRNSTESLVNIGVTRQEALEDKLLDEEICKITENMSHDEYVLTDQVTPEDPVSSSTPIKQIQKKQEESGGKNGDKKCNKSKKRNLAEEHLILESPELKGSKFDSNEPLNSVNDLEWSSSSSSCEHNSTKEMIQIVKEAKDVPEEIQHTDSAEIKNQAESIVKSLNDEIGCSKLSCGTDVKDEHHIESTRTTRSRTNIGRTRELLALQSAAYPVDDLENDSIRDKKTSTRKFYKIDNDRKEENQTSTEITRFSLRPRRNKNIQHYEESDVEADIYFMNVCMELNDEIENSCDPQKKPNEMEKEIIENALQEMTHTDIKNKDTEAAKSKPDSTNDIKKRKRGRPRLKDRIIPNSNVTLAHSEFEINENDIATSSFEESKSKDQELISQIKDNFDEASKAPYIDTNIQPSKRRGRPRKNPVQVENNLLIQAEDPSISESMKSKCNELRENTEQIESEMLLIEKATSVTLTHSLNVESLPVVEDYIRESNLSEAKRDELKVEENEILFTKMNSSENQSVQEEIESTNIKIADTVFAKNCDMLAFNVPSEKNKAADTSILSEMKICSDDEKYQPENKSDHNDTSANVLINSTVEALAEFSPEIIENVSTNDDVQSVKSIRAIELDESFEIQKPSNISEEKQIKSREELSEMEIFQKETKLVSESEGNEDEVIDDKSLPIANVGLTRELLALQSTYPRDDLENDSIRDKKTIRLESSSKKLSRSLQSANKERETNRRKSKVSRGRRKKVTAAKIAEISSDSENEVDGIESASSNKSKIVKSVFGRVFGGEKADKVKEVLNDWVSRSEDDSDISRSTSEARSCLRGSTKISENGHKKDKKRHSGILTDSDTKKDAELSPRKNGNDKGIIEVHGKLKNRKKREKDFNSMSEDRIESLLPINSAKRRHRESKIRADERIFRTFDDESLILSESEENVNEIKETSNQFDDDYMNNKNDESKRYYEEEWNEERIKDRNSISVDCENLQVDHNTYGKSKNSSSYRKKQDTNARNERSSSPSQFNMFKCRRRESKIKAGEKIWYTLDNETSSCLSDDQDLNEMHKNFKERESGFHEFRDADRSNNSKNVKHKDNDTWKNISIINQEQIEAQNTRGKSRKDSNNHKKQNFNTIGIGKTKADNMIAKNSDNDLLIALKNQKTKNEMQNDQATRSTNESINRSKNLIVTDNTCEFFAYMNHQLTNSKKSKKGTVNEDWKCSMKSLEFEKEDLAKDQPIEKEIRQKHEVSTTLSRSCSNLAGLTMKDQFAELEENSQAIRESDNDDNNDEEEEQEDDDDDDDNDLGRRRMSPFYACETPDSSIESSSNNEEDEEEEGEEDEEERITHEDTSRKTNPSEFSGEKIVIRSPSSGHRSDVVTIAPTDAIEDNALDVPREIESTEPRQGKILNFDEELFVECCSRLKATSENELRGAKKIKLDHTESYHRRDDQPQGFKVNKDRWRDVESQNSLGSLLESVNQLLGEEMCNSHDRSYRTRGSEQSSRSASPDASRVDNLGYEDSLDVAFEHNNKLRDKIQQRMRESENLIASTFGQKINDNDHPGDNDHKRCSIGNSYSSNIHEHEQSTSIASNRERVPSPGHKNKVNSTLGGLLDKALSNLLHSNSKHDHNGSAPMKLLAELACARAPTSTSPEDTTNNGKNHQSVKMVAVAVAAAAAAAATATKDTSDLSKKPTKGSTITSKTSLTKKTRNPIKELFERKKEINDRKEQERSKTTLVELSMQKPRKPKRGKKQQQQEFPLIRRNELYGGMMEKKKRRDSFDRKGESERIKDVYEFDEEESQTAPTLGSVLSYRSQVDKSYETNWPKKDLDGKLSTASENGKTNCIADTKLGVIIDHKFQELEKFAPKTKGALKSFQSEEQQQQRVTDSITGPMDDFVERKQQRLKRLEQSAKQSNKLKKRGKSSKKRARNAWYENDSSDEFRTAAKAEDVGVGISKSQRACSKGKQNLFAELSTSSESEYEREDDVDYGIAKEQQSLSKSRKSLKKQLDIDNMNCDQHVINESKFDNENLANCDWQNQVVQKDVTKKDYNAAKSESEMSDRSLVIDERKATDETRNSDDDADNQYERTFELEDLYREDSSELETEVEGNEEPTTEEAKDKVETQTLDDENATLQTKIISTNVKDDYAPENELIPLEEALDLLDRHILESKSENDSKHSKIQTENDSINDTLDTMNEVSNDGTINMEKENEHLTHIEAQDEKEELDDDVPALPEKLSSNEKPQKESDNNLPLHVFLSRKVQESKKRKQQQLDKLREEQERILMDFQPTRRQRKCAIGKQGLLAEISSSDEESYARDNNKKGNDHDKSRKKRESKEKKKERYLEKKHEQMIAKEQKAIEEEILREVGKRKEIFAQSPDVDTALNIDVVETKIVSGQAHKKKHQPKEKQKKSGDENIEKSMQHTINESPLDSSEDIRNNLHAFCSTENIIDNNGHLSISSKRKKLSKSPTRLKKIPKSGENGKISPNKKNKESTAEKSKKTSASNSKDSKERRSSGGKHDSDDEELKTTKSWNKVEEGVGVAIGRRKRTAAHQLYYWSSSSDEEEAPELVLVPEEEEDDRQEQHGWIVGDSHKRMITMLAMEKQQKEKRRRSEDEFESGKSKSKKHRNSTS